MATTLEEACFQPRIVRREGGQLLDLRLPNMPPPVLICDDVETVALAVQSGLGVALLPEWLAQGTPGLVQIPMHLYFPDGIYRAVLPGGRSTPRRTRALLDHLALTLANGLPS
ncbi:MAG: DNA-binding transcriptional LysR family regulator [Cognaticolwellia sp.]|jgi:DNA-binding transcriptional LysR family regulator